MTVELPPELAEQAQRELGETPELRDKLLADLHARLEALPEADRPHRTDDEYLIAFLRGTKAFLPGRNIDEAFRKIMNMEKFRRENEAQTQNLRAEEFREMYGLGFMRVLSGHDRQGRLVSTLLPAKLGGLRDADMFVRWNFWAINTLLADPYLQVNGQVIIENFEGFKLMDMIRMKNIPQSVMQKCFKMQQECAPMRLRGIFIVNEPRYMDFLWALVRPFMKKKLRDRVHFIGRDVRAFHEFIDPAVLPPEFGGTLDEPPTAWLDRQIELEAAQQQAGHSDS